MLTTRAPNVVIFTVRSLLEIVYNSTGVPAAVFPHEAFVTPAYATLLARRTAVAASTFVDFIISPLNLLLVPDRQPLILNQRPHACPYVAFLPCFLR